MKCLRSILLILALPILALQFQAMAGEITQEMINQAAEAHGLRTSGMYSLNAEGNRDADFYGKLLAAGAIGEDNTLNPVFAQAYAQLGDPSEKQLDRLCSAYQFSAKEESPSAEGLLAALKALEYGEAFNQEINDKRKQGFKMQSKVAKVVAKMVFPDRTHALISEMASNDGRLIPFDTVIKASLCSIPLKKIKVNRSARTLINLVANIKTDPDIQSAVNHEQEMKKAFQLLAEESGLTLQPVIPGKLVEHYKSQSRTATVIAALLQHAPRLQGAVYLMAFYGHSQYQYFTVSIYNGYINITFAADNHEDSTPVVIANMKTDQMDYESLARSLNEMMEGKEKAPNLLGIWRIANQ